MKKISMVAAALTAAFLAAPSFAVPIRFDFTGTVLYRNGVDSTGTSTSDPAVVGQSFTAQLVLDVDRFQGGTLTESPGLSRELSFTTDRSPISPWSLSMAIGGFPVAIDTYDLNYADLKVDDTQYEFIGDAVQVSIRSDLSGVNGVTRVSQFVFTAADFFAGGISPSYVDLDQPFSVDDLLTIPLPNLSLSYITSTYNCPSFGSCAFSSLEGTGFNVTSVTRSVDVPAPVPEPGAFGLFASAMLGMWAFARRRIRASNS